MSLRGDLRTMALPDVLQWVATGHKTGTLHVERRSVQKRIILREGNIFSSWSNDPRESLGQFLIRRGEREEGDRWLAEASRRHPDSWCIWRQRAGVTDQGLAALPDFWERVDALGDRRYYARVDMEGMP